MRLDSCGNDIGVPTDQISSEADKYGFQDPVHGAQSAGSWAVRESFVAVVTTNLPLVWSLFYVLLKPFVSWISTSLATTKRDTSSGGLVHIGGATQRYRHDRDHRRSEIAGGTFAESEEHIVRDLEMNSMTTLEKSNSCNFESEHPEGKSKDMLEIRCGSHVA